MLNVTRGQKVTEFDLWQNAFPVKIWLTKFQLLSTKFDEHLAKVNVTELKRIYSSFIWHITHLIIVTHDRAAFIFTKTLHDHFYQKVAISCIMSAYCTTCAMACVIATNRSGYFDLEICKNIINNVQWFVRSLGWHTWPAICNTHIS